MSSLIHDTNAAFSTLDSQINQLSKWLSEYAKEAKEKGIKVSSVPFVAVEYIKSRSENLKNAVNNYYNEFRNDFK